MFLLTTACVTIGVTNAKAKESCDNLAEPNFSSCIPNSIEARSSFSKGCKKMCICFNEANDAFCEGTCDTPLYIVTSVAIAAAVAGASFVTFVIVFFVLNIKNPKVESY